MTAIPFYNMIVLPEVSFFFQGEYFREIAGKDVKEGEELVFLMLKEDKKREDTAPEDFYPIGVYGVVESIGEDESVGVRTVNRVDVENIRREGDRILFDAHTRPEIDDLPQEEQNERFNKIRSQYLHFLSDTQWGLMIRNYILQWKDINEMVSQVSMRLQNTNEEKYDILATDSVSERFDKMERAVMEMLELFRVSNEAESAQAETNEKMYREDAIRKQIEFLQKELDEMHPENVSDVRSFEKKIEESGMNETARKEAMKVLGRMKQEGQHGTEYGLLYDYLDFVTGLSWKRPEPAAIDLKEAEAILEEDHYGLKKVKQRVLQQIAVMQLRQMQSGSILLFVGPPGTGKTSIGQSIARALGREYVRVSLGGVRDEAEIRGHRRTYIGAMPGRIMDAIKKSGVSNPVMVLDEVDKLSVSYNGDPASALLEVLDPEQNNTFTDHYMNVPYDLSGVLFVCTANTTDTIPEPLLNRMEMIEFPGYTATEKLQIARRHLLPQAMEAMGIKKSNLRISDAVIRTIIADYTAESGKRKKKKRLDTLCRVAAVKLVKGEQRSVTVSQARLKSFLDAKPIRHDHILETKAPGIVTGLAWTRAGGEILFVETVFTKGKGEVIITGQLGDVMKESVRIAISLVKTRYPEKTELFEKNDLHIHVPEGAVPKDGPSAGITLTTALASLVTEKPVAPCYAMTGEVSLRGLVMPIGGLPEKLMAAVRAGITRVLIPKDNVDDLEEIAEEVKEKLTIIPVKSVDEVLRIVEIAE